MVDFEWLLGGRKEAGLPWITVRQGGEKFFTVALSQLGLDALPQLLPHHQLICELKLSMYVLCKFPAIA